MELVVEYEMFFTTGGTFSAETQEEMIRNLRNLQIRLTFQFNTISYIKKIQVVQTAGAPNSAPDFVY